MTHYKISSKSVLNQAGLRSLNEMAASASAVMIWKSKLCGDPLGKKVFPVQSIDQNAVNTRSSQSDKIKIPVPGYPSLAVNLMATAWNEIPELRKASTIGSAKRAANNWAKSLYS